MSLYRCQQNDDAKVVLADAVQHVEQSVNVWLATADLENGEKARKLVLRRGTTFLHIFLTISYHYAALEHIPNFVRLWKETVNLETSPADARTLLSRAVEVIPLSVEPWLALARLETPENGKVVLNKARKAVPTSHEIRIAAGRLMYAAETSEEKRTEELDRVDKTLATAVWALRAHGVLLTREQWLKEAERCEAEGAPRSGEDARLVRKPRQVARARGRVLPSSGGALADVGEGEVARRGRARSA